MKIAVNTRMLIKGKLEGLGKYTDETLRRMVRNHPEHEFYFFFDRPFDKSFVYADNVQPYHLFPPARHPVLFVWWFELSVGRMLKKIKPDVFLSPDAFLCMNTKVPSLPVVHDIAYCHFPEQLRFYDRWYYNYFMHRFFEKAGRIATVSDYTKQDLIKHYGISADKIDITPNGCDAEFKPLEEEGQKAIRKEFSGGKPYFLYTGSIHPRKNVARMIQAFDQMKSNSGGDIQLLLAGRKAWLVAEVEAAYNNAKNKESIHFLGYVPKETLPKLMAAAYGLCYVSLFEGFGLPVLEAMYCDTPVITSNVSSMPEVAGEAALLVDPQSVDSIANAFELLWQDVELRVSLIEKGKIQRAKFDWEITAEKLWESIERLLG